MMTTDISKMKRVVEVNTKRDDKQYELSLRSRSMAGPRKGLYDDRSKEELMAPVRPEGPYPNYFDAGKAIEGKYCGDPNCLCKPRQFRPEGPYPDNMSEAEMLVKAQDAQRGTVPEAVKVVQKDIKDELSTVTNELTRLTEMLKKTPIDQLFDFREIKAQLDKLEALVATSPAEATKEEKEAYEKDLQQRTAEEFNLHGAYTGIDMAKGKGSTVYQLRYGDKVHNVDIKNMPTKDIEFWILKFRQARVELEGKDIPYYINPRLRQAEIDGMKSIEKELMEKVRGKPVVRIGIKDSERNKAQVRGFGRVYGRPKGMTDKDWEQLVKEIKEAHKDDPAPGPNDGLSDDDLYQEMKAEEALEKELKAVSEQDWYRKAASDVSQLTNEEKEYYRKALSADPHEWPKADVKDHRTMKLRWQEAIEQLTEELRSIPKDQLFNHPRIAEVVSRILSTEEIIVPPMPSTYPSGQARYVAENGSLYDPKLTIIAKYAETVAQRKKEQKKRKVYKVITVVSKVIIGSFLIYIGLIIMENILAGKPISTFLNRILIEE